MTDDELLHRINKLVEEEHTLERNGVREDAEQAARLRQVENSLDKCWDLLRQRRARREMGQDPETAATRSTGVVEGYQQ